MFTQISFCLLLIMSVANVNAAPIVKPTPTPTPVKEWALEWSNKYQSSLHGSDDANKRASVISIAAVNYFANPTLRIQGVVGGIQAIKPSKNFRVINPEFRSHFLLSEKEDKLKITVGPTLVLPFGTDAKEESLIFGAGVGARAILNLKKKDDSGFRFYYDLTFNKNFHQFETSVFSEVNNQLALNHSFYLEYNFDAQWNLNTTFSFSSLWSYYGLLTNNYSVEQELDFSASDLVTLFISHTRGGDFLAPNGQNYSFGLFNADSSRISLGLILSF